MVEIYEVLAVRMRKLITARKDHSIPLRVQRYVFYYKALAKRTGKYS